MVSRLYSFFWESMRRATWAASFLKSVPLILNNFTVEFHFSYLPGRQLFSLDIFYGTVTVHCENLANHNQFSIDRWLLFEERNEQTIMRLLCGLKRSRQNYILFYLTTEMIPTHGNCAVTFWSEPPSRKPPYPAAGPTHWSFQKTTRSMIRMLAIPWLLIFCSHHFNISIVMAEWEVPAPLKGRLESSKRPAIAAAAKEQAFMAMEEQKRELQVHSVDDALTLARHIFFSSIYHINLTWLLCEKANCRLEP